MIGSANAAKAAREAGNQQYQATQDSLALQREIYEQNRADNEPFRQVGLNAANALSGAFGLGPVSMTGSSSSAGGGSAPSVDWDAYLAANPDIAAEYRQEATRDAKSQANLQAIGANSPEAYAQWHVNNYGARGELPMMAVAQSAPAAASPGGAQAGYTDPTAVGGYTMTERAALAPLDVSLNAFRASPDYEFRFAEGEKALGSMASANRGLMSGQRMKALTRYGQNMADGEYTDWRNYVTGQYNADRNFNEAQYQTDRSRLDSRYDTRNNQLMTLAGFGSSATAQNQNAAQSFANNSTNLNLAGAQAQGNAGMNAANAWNQGLGNLMTAGAYLGGQYLGSKTAGTPPITNQGYSNGYNPTWMAS
ncbi:hypothetical protein LJR164_001634 [Phenylobacterium sp. LjRoot164]|uniref:hypothetical protein n=1 Tax=unclassified Phenylobacterium TaxID=2640670 RepID=UPI003ECD6822